MSIYLIEENEVRLTRDVMARLYSEKKMDADDMRDHAQKLQCVVDHLMEAE